VLRGGSKEHPVKGTVDASDEQIGPVLSGDAQYFAIRLTGGEYMCAENEQVRSGLSGGQC
jgi:hypothetical protein